LNSAKFADSSLSESNAETHLRIGAMFEDLRSIDKPIDDLVNKYENLDEATAYNVKLAVHEICTNIVEHAYEFEQDAQINIWISIEKRPSVWLTVTLCDSGRPFHNQAEARSEPSSELDDHGDGGYGLFLANALMNSVEYRRIDGQNVWRLEKQLISL
jgi:serine/threonine-protein kinase RsbW